MLLGRILISFLYSICPGFPAPLIEKTIFFPLYILASFIKDMVHICAYLKCIHFYFVVLYMIFKAFTFLVFIWLLFSYSVVSDSLQPHGPQHARLPCPSPSPRVCSNSCLILCDPGLQHARLPCPAPSPRVAQIRVHWVGDAIQPSHPVSPFSSCPQSFPASGSFPMSWLSAAGGQSIGASASASVLPVNIQGWFPLGLTGLILQSKGLLRVLQHHNSKASIFWHSAFFTVQLSHPIDYMTTGKIIALSYIGKKCFADKKVWKVWV